MNEEVKVKVETLDISQLEVVTKPNMDTNYSNFLRVLFDPTEFILDFGYIGQKPTVMEGTDRQITLVSRIIVSPDKIQSMIDLLVRQKKAFDEIQKAVNSNVEEE